MAIGGEHKSWWGLRNLAGRGHRLGREEGTMGELEVVPGFRN